MHFSSIVLDILFLAVIIFTVVRGFQNGFLRSVILVAGYLASAYAAVAGGQYVATWAYSRWIRPSLIENISNTVAASGDQSLNEIIPQIFENLPGFLVKPLISFNGGAEMIFEKIGHETQDFLNNTGELIADQVVAPVVTAALELFFFLLIFAVCVIIVKAVASLFKRMYTIPLIGPVNTLLGGVLGIAEAAVWVYLLMLAASLFLTFTGDKLLWMNSKIIEESLLFGRVYQFLLF